MKHPVIKKKEQEINLVGTISNLKTKQRIEIEIKTKQRTEIEIKRELQIVS
jgi:hypothetical protein